MERNLNVNPDDPSKAASERTIGLLAAVWLFCWFASYFVQRQLREVFGIVQGVENLPTLFLVGAIVILPANFAFSAFAGRRAAIRVIGVVSVIVATALLAFAFGLHEVHAGADGWLARTLTSLGLESVNANAENWLARAFYVSVGVFNLFAVSLFWGTMAVLFQSESAKRWYGILSAGGTLGAIAGGLIVKGVIALGDRYEWLAGERHTIALLVIAATLFLCGSACAIAISRRVAGSSLRAPRVVEKKQISALVGLRRCLASPYLLAICLFLMLYTVTSTVLSIERSVIVKANFGADRAAIGDFSATIDIWRQSLSLVGQLVFTSAWLRSLGVRRGLAFVPGITILGFAVVAGNPALGVVAVFDVVRAVAEYVVTRPSREVLYTVVSREEKYEAKVFIDTFVYRLGDAFGSGFLALTMWFELGVRGTFLAATPLAVIWLVVALKLGKHQAQLARENGASATATPITTP